MKLKSLKRQIIICIICNKHQEFCVTGRPLSGLCTECRKKKFKKDNPEVKKPDIFCKCGIRVGKNSKTGLCRACYVAANKDKITQYSKLYTKNRYSNDLLFMLSKRLRSRLSHAIREFSIEKRNVSAIKDLGCSINKLKIHLQMLFYRDPRDRHEYMTWNNYGKWHIDHIRPLSSAKTEVELLKLCHYSNLQPLWKTCNLKKNNKLNQ